MVHLPKRSTCTLKLLCNESQINSFNFRRQKLQIHLETVCVGLIERNLSPFFYLEPKIFPIF